MKSSADAGGPRRTGASRAGADHGFLRLAGRISSRTAGHRVCVGVPCARPGRSGRRMFRAAGPVGSLADARIGRTRKQQADQDGDDGNNESTSTQCMTTVAPLSRLVSVNCRTVLQRHRTMIEPTPPGVKIFRGSSFATSDAQSDRRVPVYQ